MRYKFSDCIIHLLMASFHSHEAVTSHFSVSPLSLPPIMHHCSTCSPSTAPPLTVVRVARVLGLETGERISAGRKGELVCRDSRSREPAHCLAFINGIGRTQTADVSWLPSCSCCMPTCSSGTSVEWSCSGCAGQCHSAETGQSSAYI